MPPSPELNLSSVPCVPRELIGCADRLEDRCAAHGTARASRLSSLENQAVASQRLPGTGSLVSAQVRSQARSSSSHSQFVSRPNQGKSAAFGSSSARNEWAKLIPRKLVGRCRVHATLNRLSFHEKLMQKMEQGDQLTTTDPRDPISRTTTNPADKIAKFRHGHDMC